MKWLNFAKMRLVFVGFVVALGIFIAFSIPVKIIPPIRMRGDPTTYLQSIQDTNIQFRYESSLFSSSCESVVVTLEVVVKLTSESDVEKFQKVCEVMDLAIKKRLEFTECEFLIEVLGADEKAVSSIVEDLNEISFVEWAAPNIVLQIRLCSQVIPDDLCGKYWPYEWHLHNTGQSSGTPDADINAPEAWEITTGDPNIVIAVLDTGIELDHPDLVNNLVPGYDFLDDDDLPEPVLSSHQDAPHGTCCAGLVAAEGNNGIGVVGVAWNCKIMPVRIGVAPWEVTAEVAATAIRWAATNGADVLSCSWRTTDSPIVNSALTDATSSGGIGRDGKGCIVVFSAGNENSPITGFKGRSDIIAVGATDDHDQRWSYSNYGPGLDVVAPAGGPGDVWIATTDICGSAGFYTKDYTPFTGTSCACPIVAGVAALILSVESELNSEEVRHFLTRSAKDLGDPGRDDYYGWGRVDARAALDMVLAKRADLNHNWIVDMEDLLILIEFWRKNEPSADIAPATKRDGIVDELDLELLMRYWQTEIPEPGLIAHWELDETEGTFAEDSAGHNDGVLNGDPLWQPSGGKVGGALEFDGIDDYISTPFILNPGKGSMGTFAWIKGSLPGQVILSQTGDLGETWLGIEPAEGKLMTGFSGIYFGDLVSEIVVTDGQWHHVGFVYDLNSLHRLLYVDGVLVAEDATVISGMPSDGGLHIGASKDLEAGTFFSGLIDDVRIYNQVLTAEEIAALAQ